MGNGVEMKRLIYYAFIMAVVVLIIPLFIVKSCTAAFEDEHLQEAPQPVLTFEQESEEITVYNTESKTVDNMDLEEYVKCVVAAEMPAAFEIEALKAQAVAARTYAFTRILNNFDGKDDLHHGSDVCTDPAHCQAWISMEDAMSSWEKDKAKEYWDKIEGAVEETRGIIITYEDMIANPVFHSNSGGRTENALAMCEIAFLVQYFCPRMVFACTRPLYSVILNPVVFYSFKALSKLRHLIVPNFLSAV
jgi:stage II sporulation protein D